MDKGWTDEGWIDQGWTIEEWMEMFLSTLIS